jgi:ADP-ribose pyrophosphatase
MRSDRLFTAVHKKPAGRRLNGGKTLTEKTLSVQRVYEGKIINLRRDTVELEGGGTAVREVVEHSGGVGVLALDEKDRVLMVRQFRYGVGRESLEIPAGKLNPGEDPEACGRRELEEETGYRPVSMTSMGFIDPSPAYVGEIIYIFLASGLEKTSQNLDEDERLEVERVPFDKAVAMCITGEITDAKTVAAVLKHAVAKRENAPV